MDEDHAVDVIYLDFAKAFDHGFLSAKMASFGLDDVVARWIETYLSGWVSIVHVSGKPSETIPMRSDFPQASIINPFLFLLFVNKFPDAFEALTLLFLDDVGGHRT